ncbi:DUF4355 domain-containing protein [Lysinibacillus halotolerans]
MKINSTLDFLNKIYLSLDIQFFAEGPTEPIEPTEPVEPPTEPLEPTEPTEPVKTYTQDELEEIIKQRLAREKKAAEKAIKEAEKLAKMNEEQKKQYEFEKLQKELEEYKRKDTFYSLSKEASKMLSEHEIVADDELLEMLVKDTAEDTQSAVNSFVTLLNKHVEAGVKKALAGKPPKKAIGSNKGLTKADILAEKDANKRIKLIQEHPELFN